MMGCPDFRTVQLTDMIDWLTTLRSVTDFEAPALTQLVDACEQNSLKAQKVDGGLLVGNSIARTIFVTHVDRIGFVMLDGPVKDGAAISLVYTSESARVNPETVRERLSDTLLVGYDPETGDDLFVASLSPSTGNLYLASICHVFDSSMSLSATAQRPIPVTGVKPGIARIGDYLQGCFDNSAGLAIALTATARHADSLAVIVTVSEEGGGYLRMPTGGRGIRRYIHKHDPEALLVVIDVRPSSLTDSDSGITRVGAGTVLRTAEWREDEDGLRKVVLRANERALRYIRNFAADNQIPVQVFEGLGITEGGRAQEELGDDIQLNCLWLQPPVAYYHSSREVTTLTDLIGTQRLAEALAYRI